MMNIAYAYLSALLLMLSGVLGTASAWAGPGHDHGESPAAPSAAAFPRFTASSEDFELVGVLQEHRLTVYLDHAPDNRPVDNAQLTLEVAGQKLPLTPQEDAGTFSADWPEALNSGEIAITAVIQAGTQSDLLVAELDLHDAEEAHTGEQQAPSNNRLLWVLAAVSILLAGAGLGNTLYSRRRHSTGAKA